MTTDMLGKEVSEGDTIAVSFRAGNTAELRIGTVLGFSERKESYGSGRVELIVVEWVKSSMSYGLPGESKIESRTKRFVVVDLPA